MMQFGWISGFAFGCAIHCFLEHRWIDGGGILAFSVFAIFLPKLMLNHHLEISGRSPSSSTQERTTP